VLRKGLEPLVMNQKKINHYTTIIRSCVTQDQIDNFEVRIENNEGFVPEVLRIVFRNQRAIIFSDNAEKISKVIIEQISLICFLKRIKNR
jgi:hypothetical protein